MWQKIRCWLKQLFCKHEWKCLNYDCKYRKPDWCGDEGLIHGTPLCWACYSRPVICKRCGKIKK